MEPIAILSRKKIFLTDLLHLAIFTIVFGSAMFIFLQKYTSSTFASGIHVVVPYQEDPYKFYLHQILLMSPIVFLGVLTIIVKRNFILGFALLLRVLQLFFIAITLLYLIIFGGANGMNFSSLYYFLFVVLSYLMYFFLLKSAAKPLQQKNKLSMIIWRSLASLVIIYSLVMFYLVQQGVIDYFSHSWVTQLPVLN